MKTKNVVIGTLVGLGLAGVAYAIYQGIEGMKNDAGSLANQAKSPTTVPTLEQMQNSSANNQPAITKRKGDLQVVVTLRASGIEKALANRTSLSSDILAAAKRIGSQLPSACPGAPALAGQPTVGLRDISSGFEVTINWPALWKGTETGPVRGVVKDCLTNLVKQASDDIKNRFVSLNARRINAYA